MAASIIERGSARKSSKLTSMSRFTTRQDSGSRSHPCLSPWVTPLGKDMAALPDHNNIVAVGTYLYDDTVECDICIAYSPVRYGSGDYEDLPELGHDVEVDTYYLWFGSTLERNRFNAGGGGFPSLQEAMKNAEDRPGFGGSVRWK